MKHFATLIGAIEFLEKQRSIGSVMAATSTVSVLIVIPRGGKLRLHRVTLRQLDCCEWSVMRTELVKEQAFLPKWFPPTRKAGTV